LIRTPCDTQHTVQTIAKLEAFAGAGDRRAASFIADCLRLIRSTPTFSEGSRRLIAAAAIATASADPDEELKFGWLLMSQTDRVQGPGVDRIARDTVKAAATYLLRAAEHGRPAAYEGLSLLHRQFLHLLDPGPERDKVAARNPTEWIDLAAQAGHPKSRCAVGVRLATEMSQKASVDEATRKRFQEYFEACLRGRNPRQVIFRDGKERTLGHDPLFDIWMREDPFLVTSPRYENYNYDIAGRDDALAKMTRMMSQR
jgi:TPR repeat protein